MNPYLPGGSLYNSLYTRQTQQPLKPYTVGGQYLPGGASYGATYGGGLNKGTPVQAVLSGATSNLNTRVNTLNASPVNNQLNNQQPQQQAQAPVDPYAGLRNDISSAWDAYTGSLNDTANTWLPQQQASQQQIANSQYDQGVSLAETQRAKSLRDIASNTRNAFQAANNFLGTHGATDSSAANQYSFAIQQEANKQTGGLNEFVNTQLSNLGYQRDQQISSITNWFAQQQQAIKQAISTGQLNRQQDINNLSKNILDQSLAAMKQIKDNSMNQYNALLGWAANNSTNLNQLTTNIRGIPQALGQMQVDSSGNYILPIGAEAIRKAKLDSTGNFQLPTGAGAFGSQERTDIFGNPIA